MENKASQYSDPIALQFGRLREGYNHCPCPTLAERKQHLSALKKQLQRYQDVIAIAANKDFGCRAAAESKLIDVLGPVLEINHLLHRLKKWMKPSRRSTELLFAGNRAKVVYQPKGVVGIICPWNFPLYLSLGPLVAALGAGNRAMIKMPPNCPEVTRVLQRMIGEIFATDHVTVIAGNHPNAMHISSLPFDHLIFTGSPQSGRQIMANAAENLVPVTLELGGKSPAFVAPDADINDAAKRIAHGKAFNAGQVCLSPDYALVPEKKVSEFISLVKKHYLAMHPQTEGGADFTALIDENANQRFLSALDDAKKKGAVITACGELGAGRQHPLHIVSAVSDDMTLMQTELFSPILPVLGYCSIKQALDEINARPRPLAIYLFSHDKALQQKVLVTTHSGGVTINDWGWHAFNHDLPFGGIGNSGMGSYHGVEGFRTLSHAKAVFQRNRFYPIGLFYPPYGTQIQKAVMRFFLRQPDTNLDVSNTEERSDAMNTKNFEHAESNLVDALTRFAQQTPDKTAVVCGGKQLTYKDLDLHSNKVANVLREEGIKAGDNVALSCPNIPYFPIIYYGILKAGGVVVPLNVLLKENEIAYHLQDSEAKAYFCFEGTDQLPMGQSGASAFTNVETCRKMWVMPAGDKLGLDVSGFQRQTEIVDFSSILLNGSDEPVANNIEEQDTAVILYTSGTTGRPKGAQLTHRNMHSNARVAVGLSWLTADDTSLVTLPLFHSFGQTAQMNACILVGASMVLVPRFEPGAVLQLMKDHRVSVFAGVPTMYIGILNYLRDNDVSLDGIKGVLKMAMSGGSSLPVAILTQFDETFNVPLLEGYGLSETSPIASFNHVDSDRLPGSVGQPVTGVEMKVVDVERNTVAVGELGEIAIRGPNVMRGYYNRPEATDEVLDIDGWFFSGDIGRRDERNNYFIVDRKKELIIRGGMNVYPREIEEVLIRHEKVAMVAVLGVADDTYGEEVKAYVVAHDGFDDADALIAYCKSQLADYKYPRHIEFRAQLPMTATGKLLKRELKAEVEKSSQ
nr:long-chain-fatty-acid--CoA ligase [Grimontia hollisae]